MTTCMTFLVQVLNVLKRISDEDCLLLGLNPKYARPDWMILQVLPIPPPPVRPSVMMDTSSRSEVSQIPFNHYVSNVCWIGRFTIHPL
jgi:DNA-directed RNA polymerase beta' subunit